MKIRNYLSLIILLSAVAGAPFSAQADKVRVHPKPDLSQTDYCLADDLCRICWTTHQAPLNETVVQHRSDCDHALDLQAPLWDHLLAHILTHDPARDRMDTLFWGRLASGNHPNRQEMAYRLSLAASRSPGWNAKIGSPQKQGLNDFVHLLANSANIYPELKKVFAGHGLTLHVSGVEKVLVLPANRLPFYDKLKIAGVGPDEKLPFDCLLWFRIESTTADTERNRPHEP
jgi:hypothetical protein